eukprot:s520_g6.t1
MRQAEARMRTEAASLGEEALEDRKVDETVSEGVKGSIENCPLKEVEDVKQESAKKSPEVVTPKAKSGAPLTPPPAYLPSQDPRSAGLKTPEQSSELRGAAEVREEQLARRSPKRIQAEQARALHELHDRAPWLHQSGRSVFSPFPQRPAFVDQEEERLREGLSERDRQLQLMRDQLFREQVEKDELRRTVSSVLEDNKRMMVRLQDLEAKVKDPEPRFPTPEDHQSKEAETTKTILGAQEAETPKARKGSGPAFAPEEAKPEAAGN